MTASAALLGALLWEAYLEAQRLGLQVATEGKTTEVRCPRCGATLAHPAAPWYPEFAADNVARFVRRHTGRLQRRSDPR